MTREHVHRYFDLERRVGDRDAALFDSVDRYADFCVISQTGARNPRIHPTLWLVRDDSFDLRGVAIFKDERFWASVTQVTRSVEQIRSAEMSPRFEPAPQPVPA